MPPDEEIVNYIPRILRFLEKQKEIKIEEEDLKKIKKILLLMNFISEFYITSYYSSKDRNINIYNIDHVLTKYIITPPIQFAPNRTDKLADQYAYYQSFITGFLSADSIYIR